MKQKDRNKFKFDYGDSVSCYGLSAEANKGTYVGFIVTECKHNNSPHNIWYNATVKYTDDRYMLSSFKSTRITPRRIILTEKKVDFWKWKIK